MPATSANPCGRHPDAPGHAAPPGLRGLVGDGGGRDLRRRIDLAFVAEPDPGCWEETRDGLGFTAPGPGDWAIAMPACAVGYTQFSANRICGTWYAAIDTLEARHGSGLGEVVRSRRGSLRVAGAAA